jgi:hypothetical protein
LPLISTAWSGLSCVCGSLLSVAVGALYGVWISRSGGAGPDEGAIGGAASAATAQALGSLLQSALSLIVLPFALEQAGSQLGQVFDPAIIGLSVMTSGFGALISVCSGALFGGLLGALGGVIGTFLSRRPA